MVEGEDRGASPLKFTFSRGLLTRQRDGVLLQSQPSSTGAPTSLCSPGLPKGASSRIFFYRVLQFLEEVPVG